MVKTKKIILMILGGVFSVLLVFYVIFSQHNKGPILPCVFNKLTGYYCPGCGMTRAVNALFRLEFYQSFRYNALLYIAFPLIALYFWKKRKGEENEKIVYFVLFLSVLYGVLRNTDLFSFLAPTALK